MAKDDEDTTHEPDHEPPATQEEEDYDAELAAIFSEFRTRLDEYERIIGELRSELASIRAEHESSAGPEGESEQRPEPSHWYFKKLTH